MLRPSPTSPTQHVKPLQTYPLHLHRRDFVLELGHVAEPAGVEQLQEGVDVLALCSCVSASSVRSRFESKLRGCCQKRDASKLGFRRIM